MFKVPSHLILTTFLHKFKEYRCFPATKSSNFLQPQPADIETFSCWLVQAAVSRLDCGQQSLGSGCQLQWWSVAGRQRRYRTQGSVARIITVLTSNYPYSSTPSHPCHQCRHVIMIYVWFAVVVMRSCRTRWRVSRCWMSDSSVCYHNYHN